MFRDPSFYATFRKEVVPLLKTYPTVQVWIAGCSTGEEVYSLAILLQEENLYPKCRIYATDISQAVLRKARAGIFPLAAMREYTANYHHAGGTHEFSDYYTAQYDSVLFSNSLRANIVFSEHNLATDYAIGQMHVIFCRNVLFYFDKALRRRAVDTFAAGLCSGGFLCLGATEAAPLDSAGVFAGFVPEQRIFRRAGAA